VNVKTSAEGGSGGALEADGNAVITRTEVRGNTVMVTSDTGVAAAVAVVNIFDGAGRAVMRDSIISGNHVTATSRSGVAIVRGAGLANNGPLLLSHVTISGNSATASAPHGWGRGGGVFNGLVFPSQSPSLVVHGGTISHNILRVRHGAIASGGGSTPRASPHRRQRVSSPPTRRTTASAAADQPAGKHGRAASRRAVPAQPLAVLG
jgi:hypothetical protein